MMRTQRLKTGPNPGQRMPLNGSGRRSSRHLLSVGFGRVVSAFVLVPRRGALPAPMEIAERSQDFTVGKIG